MNHWPIVRLPRSGAAALLIPYSYWPRCFFTRPSCNLLSSYPLNSRLPAFPALVKYTVTSESGMLRVIWILTALLALIKHSWLVRPPISRFEPKNSVYVPVIRFLEVFSDNVREVEGKADVYA